LRYALASRLEETGEESKAKILFREVASNSNIESVSGAAFYRLALKSDIEEKETLLKNCLIRIPTHKRASEMLTSIKMDKAYA